ncbi:MAG: hypothetical protein A2452_05170 [Candidatus Firestonebacteria bacterium RIFOXYC2_FULL_39_67]|nr:MAG: hypothetical protein A2536_10735 [Candidatus Firestonebacteria bacterium RIFOXYD2_FULL_39_29]OGF53028.1 MAG: hypothetical protein A2497_02520 [Candidatus Firestonebacteria bacterium RifOxyC12_full_39_7]OGF54516.1 MAG: hypothetical protein A2452_05170 [Candidatus Firestonebacteria bacterium RIFOXYC2_FULL_39_67]
MFDRFLPKEYNFFGLLEKQADYAVEAAKIFKEAVVTGSMSEETLNKMQEVEHQGDDVTHSILDQLDKTFITPIDREDIHALAKEMDDITDMLCTISSRMRIYKISKVDKHLVEFGSIIEESVLGVLCAIKGLRDLKNVKTILKACVEVNRLENAGDKKRDEALVELFETEKDPIAIIKWKEIYQEAETVLDICEDVTNIVESILVKNA